MQFGRRRWDPQPTTSAAVVLASSGEPRRRAPAREPPRAGRSLILKVFGSQFGLPNPGLLPSRREREEAGRHSAAGDHRPGGRRGCTADGQVAAG